MYSQEDIQAMSVAEIRDSLDLFFGDFGPDLLQKTAELLKQGVLTWEQVETVVGLGPGEGLDALIGGL